MTGPTAVWLCAASAAAGAAAALRFLRRRGASPEALESTLHEVAVSIAERPTRPSDSLRAIVSIVAKAVEADLCAFLLYDEKTQELVTQPGAFGLAGDEESLYRLPITNEQASSVRVFKSGASFVTGDAQNDSRVIRRFAQLWKCHSLVVVPLTLEGRRVGVMRVGSFQKDFFGPEHLHFIELIAEEAVIILGGAMLTRKLHETNERLAELNRLKDDFVSTVSHEFKTPLTSIKGFATVMLEEASGPINAEQRKFLGIIQSACDRLATLVSELLDIARLESGARMEFQPVEIDSVLRRCRENFQWQVDAKSIDLRLELSAGLPPVRADSRWLGQVIDNLVSNAVKFTPKGGRVVVEARGVGEGVQVTVSDTGPGIPPEDRPRIFEKFFRGQAPLNAPGTGLGLAIAKTVVEKHEGRLWFESEVGKGSRFHFILPVARTPVEVAAG